MLGAHMSIAGGLHRAFERARQVGCAALQIFSRNQRQWRIPPLERDAVDAFWRARSAWGDGPVAVHDSYLVNLSSTDARIRRRSVSAFAAELGRTETLGVPWLVTHPGTHGGRGIARGIDLYTRNLDRAMKRSATGRVHVLLETTAGAGTSLGGSLLHIGRILELSDHSSRLGVCVDTCHVFAAGHDIRSAGGLERFLDDLHRHVGTERLRLLHLNDSRGALGSRLDRHEHIGRGAIGEDAFARIVNHPELSGLPGVLETPKGETLEQDQRNLRLLRSMAPARRARGRS